MRKFHTPELSVLKLSADEVVRTSGTCFEIFACEDCYCTKVTCDGTYECDGQRCPTLSDWD